MQEIANFKDKLHSFTLILGKDSPTTQEKNGIAFYLRHDDFQGAELSIIDSQLDEISATKIAYNFIANHERAKIYTSSKSTLIHSKMYFLHDSHNPNITQNAIIGSSNLTASGLGLYGDSSNKELNLLCDSKATTKECKIYFDTLLGQCVDSTAEVLEALKTSYFYHSPKDILEKIAPYFANEAQDLSTNEMRDLELGAKAYGLYDFQKLATQECLKRLKTYGIALLADPVGSGKTLSALALATLYKRTAIITQAKLKAQWESYKHDSHDSFILNQNIEFYSYDEAINKGDKNAFLQNADLVIIDESHSFRNDNATYRKLKSKISHNSHLLLLSATPINNSYLDLAHQLVLNKAHITINGQHLNPLEICKRANEITKNVQDLEDLATFGESSADLATLNLDSRADFDSSNLCKDLRDFSDSPQIALPPDYYKLCNLIFSRSAKEIESHLKAQGKSLPAKAIKRENLSSIPAHIDFDLAQLLVILGVDFSREKSLSFCIYDPYSERYLPREIIDFLKSDNLSNLGDYSTPRGFLCMTLIKALESSVDAFISILDKIIAYHTSFLELYSPESSLRGKVEAIRTDSSLRDFAKQNRGNLESWTESSQDFDESFPQRLQSIIDAHYIEALSAEFYSDIKADLEKLQAIKSKLDSYHTARDFPKSAKFKALQKLIDSRDIKREKLIIWTESIVTADALTNALKVAFPHLIIESITGITSTSDFSARKRRFSPKSLHYKLGENEREIDILVATDCLSEGQNLQDCANLLNWDIAFNPVRAIQRIGRIWRIGSTHKINHITHFFPMELESYIDLEAKLRYKLEAANSATSLENPFLAREKKYNAHKDLRAKQLKAMESEFIAIEQESNAFFNLSNLFENLNPTNAHSNLKDGIFSIARIQDSPESSLQGESESSPSLAEGDTGGGYDSIESSLRDLPKANRGNPQTNHCHSEGATATEESKKITNKIIDSSLPTEAQNDKIIYCHDFDKSKSRNDSKEFCHTDTSFCHTERSEVSKNLLFALLTDIDSNDKSALYPCIYDISRQVLLPSVSQSDKYENLSKIIPLKNLTQKPQEDFTSLESLTNDYSDISALKHIFALLIKQLNTQIQHHDSRIEGSKQSDGGLFFIEPKRFRLIAWLLLNPDFDTLAKHSAYNGDAQ